MTSGRFFKILFWVFIIRRCVEINVDAGVYCQMRSTLTYSCRWVRALFNSPYSRRRLCSHRLIPIRIWRSDFKKTRFIYYYILLSSPLLLLLLLNWKNCQIRDETTSWLDIERYILFTNTYVTSDLLWLTLWLTWGWYLVHSLHQDCCDWDPFMLLAIMFANGILGNAKFGTKMRKEEQLLRSSDDTISVFLLLLGGAYCLQVPQGRPG